MLSAFTYHLIFEMAFIISLKTYCTHQKNDHFLILIKYTHFIDYVFFTLLRINMIILRQTICLTKYSQYQWSSRRISESTYYCEYYRTNNTSSRRPRQTRKRREPMGGSCIVYFSFVIMVPYITMITDLYFYSFILWWPFNIMNWIYWQFSDKK